MIWIVLLIVWILGIPVAYIVTDRVDVAWMRSCQWTEEMIAESRKDFWKVQLLMSLLSWLFLAASVKDYFEIMKCSRALDEIGRQLEALSVVVKERKE